MDRNQNKYSILVKERYPGESFPSPFFHFLGAKCSEACVAATAVTRSLAGSGSQLPAGRGCLVLISWLRRRLLAGARPVTPPTTPFLSTTLISDFFPPVLPVKDVEMGVNLDHKGVVGVDTSPLSGLQALALDTS